MTEKKVSYSCEGDHWIVALEGFHKYPQLSFFRKEKDAKGWVEVLRERHNLKGEEK